MHLWSQRIRKKPHDGDSTKEIIKITLLRRVQLLRHCNLVQKVFSYTSDYQKVWTQKSQLTENGTSSRTCQHDKRHKSRAKTRSSSRHKNEGRTVHFWTLMHVYPFMNSIEYKGRVVFRGDVVKDDSGSHAVFTEQESSASHVTGVKVLDVIVKLLWVAGQAGEFVSACTQGKTEDTPKLLRVSELKCAVDISGQKFGKTFEILLFLLEGMCTHTSWQDCFGRDSSKRFYSKTDVRKLQSGTVSSCIDNKDSFFPFSWTIWRWQGQSRSHVEKIDETSWSWEPTQQEWERFLEIPSRYASILSDDRTMMMDRGKGWYVPGKQH